MGIKEWVEDELVSDFETAIEENQDRIKKLLLLRKSGRIELKEEYRKADPEKKILIYLIGQKLANIADIQESDILESKYFYKRLDKADRTVRDKLQTLREKGLIESPKQGKHRLIPEKIPQSIDYIESSKK